MSKSKMTLDVTVTSRETIKPSSPTPYHLKTFKLSSLDQYSPQVGFPIILFYSAEADHDRLKKSLAETLRDYYPLAGKIVDNYYIDCDDNGVEYVEAQIKTRLDWVLNCPQAVELYQLLPLEEPDNVMSPETQLQIQINTFECGGIAIAARISHRVADGASLCSFMNAWAANSLGSKISLPPQFGSAALFPAKPTRVPKFTPPRGGVVTRRFVFDASKIATLKAESAHTENPTRVEVVSALLWKCLMSASPSRSKSFLVSLVVNIRSRIVPPLPDHSFGNIIIGTVASSKRGIELQELVGQLREAIKKIDGNYMKSLQDGDGLSTLDDANRLLAQYVVSSWCRFPFYEADFGWGKPTWATPLNVAHKNLVFLMDQKHGDGIEAMVTLEEEEMAMFETEKELLKYVTPDKMAY